ncbi:DUF2101 domain-containing protein, partial [Thermococci archaeon]
MDLDGIMYKIGEIAEAFTGKLIQWIKEIVNPSPSQKPPRFKFLKKLIKRELTVHELLSLNLQLSFIFYLLLALLLVVLFGNELYLTIISVAYFIYLRYILIKNRDFFVEVEPYRFFYYGLTAIGFLSFLGYLLIRRFAKNV